VVGVVADVATATARLEVERVDVVITCASTSRRRRSN